MDCGYVCCSGNEALPSSQPTPSSSSRLLACPSLSSERVYQRFECTSLPVNTGIPVDVSDKEQAEGGENLREPPRDTSILYDPTDRGTTFSNLRRARHDDMIFLEFVVAGFFCQGSWWFFFFLFFFRVERSLNEAAFTPNASPLTPSVVDDGNIVVFNGQVRWLAQLEDIDLLNYLIMLLPCRYKQLFGNVTCVFHRLMDTFMHSLDIGYDLDYGIKIESIEYILPCILPRGDLVQISKNNSREFCKNIELHE